MKVLILGAGRGGSALIELLSRSAGVEIAGIADVDPTAPGLALARQLNLPIEPAADALVSRHDADLIIDVTGDPGLPERLNGRLPPKTEWLSGTAARLVWLLVQQQHELRAQLIRMDKLATIGTFAAQISHDLKNPLYCIREFARFIDDEQDLVRIKEYAHEIEKADRYLNSMVEALSGYMRTAAGKAEPVSLPSLVDQALTLSRYAASSHDVEVIRQYQAVPPLTADANELLQIFVNLITNAIQAMEGQGRLTLTIARTDDHIAIGVRDTGPGIPPEHVPNLFVPFFTTKDRSIGTGLGLSIVQTLVSKYGGRIAVESEPAKGALFRVHLPLPPS